MSTSDLNMSPRIRRTPFTDRVEECGVSGFTVVNHMLLPKSFQNSIEEDYWHLKSNVQLWDVSCQRQVQVSGRDAEILVQKMTPRLIKNMKPGQCFYIPIIDEDAGMINDPVLLKLKKNTFWISIADSDVLLWAKGLATGLNLEVQIEEPKIYPLAIQGPKSEDLMALLFGDKIRSIKFFNFDTFEIFGKQHVIARSGYSNQDGFEIYFNGFDEGNDLWDKIWNAGYQFNISPGCPNLIDRIEAGLISYGNDFTNANNPFECNLDNFCSNENSHEFIGKDALERIKKEGIKKKIRGIVFDGDPCLSSNKTFPVLSPDQIKIGEITSATYSPRLKKNIGLSMILKEFWNDDQKVTVQTQDHKNRNGQISSLPFK
tara:strand:- start:2144 stop:3262 length:1119 start_codon:yes stop_codon:yes gene_type:complete